MSFVCYDATLGPMPVRQVRSSSFDANVTTQAVRAGGAASASQIATIEAKPQGRLTTGDLANVLSNLTSVQSGLAVAAGSIVFPWNQRSNGGLFLAGANHFSITGSDGLIMPTSISARQSDPLGAAVELDIYLTSTTGQNSPVAANINQTLTASAFQALYEFGPVSINGSQITQAISSEVIFGAPVVYEMYDGDTYPRFVYVDAEKIEPMFRFTFANMSLLNTYGPLFGSMSAAAVNFRQRADGGTTLPDANAAHVRFALNDGLAVVDSLSGQQAETGNAVITCKGKTLSVGVGVAVAL